MIDYLNISFKYYLWLIFLFIFLVQGFIHNICILIHKIFALQIIFVFVFAPPKKKSLHSGQLSQGLFSTSRFVSSWEECDCSHLTAVSVLQPVTTCGFVDTFLLSLGRFPNVSFFFQKQGFIIPHTGDGISWRVWIVAPIPGGNHHCIQLSSS